MQIIDLRSDTLTKPTPEMRRAMAEAEVGDDVFGEDPTVNRLEEMAAARIGKGPRSSWRPGTMGNLVSLLAQCGSGDEIIVGDQAHTNINEQGAWRPWAAFILASFQRARRAPWTWGESQPPSDLTTCTIRAPGWSTVENTHNLCSGAAL